MAKYHISRKAIADLDNIWEYTAREWSDQQASEYYRQLYFSIQNLSDLPNFLARNYSEIKEGLWGYRVGHHIIFFKKHDDGTVWVDRVLHEKMDYQRHL